MMANRIGISLEEIRDFILLKGGKVTNHELVKHFKDALTNQNTRDEARILFKELVNTVATITRDPDGGKQLVLKKKYRTQTPAGITAPNISESQGSTNSTVSSLCISPETPLNLRYTPVYQTSQDSSPISETLGSPLTLKAAPSFTVDSPHSSASFSRRSSQESLLSQLSLKSALSSATTSTLTSCAPSVSSSVLPSTTASLYSTGAGSTSSTYSSGTSSSSTYSAPLSNISTDRSLRTPTSPTSLIMQRQMSDESMYSTFSEVCPPTPKILNPTKDATDPPPPVPPRRKSSDKIKMELRENNEDSKSSSNVSNTSESSSASSGTVFTTPDQENKENVANVSKISVKERSQKFDKMASESALNKAALPNIGNNNFKKKQDKTDKDEEDSGSVQLLDGKTREWLVKCAQGNYQAIAKLAAENPKLVKFKDPTSGYTALHWGAKHGSLDIIKLIAGTHKADVNARTNGGYTPLHIATQFGHEEACNQLVKVYKADENLRDYSGRKPRQYQKTNGTSISADTYRKIKARKKHAAEKDLGFLRIGSLNVRVKRTTEAFSNFLGVGNADKLHKHWGSADNLPQVDHKRMPPPKIAPIKKRKSKRGQDFNSKPTVVEQHPAAPLSELNPQDSDSDTAAGFGSTWQSTV